MQPRLIGRLLDQAVERMHALDDACDAFQLLQADIGQQILNLLLGNRICRCCGQGSPCQCLGCVQVAAAAGAKVVAVDVDPAKRDLFDAVTVSMGLLGVITRVWIEVEPSFDVFGTQVTTATSASAWATPVGDRTS